MPESLLPFPPEAQLLLHCAQGHPSDAARAQVDALLSQPLRWTYVFELARWHGLTPLLHHQLSTHPQVPASALKTLRRRFQANAARSLQMTSELLRIQGAMETAHIPMVAYKGPLLAQALFNNLTLRQCYDLDLLVSPEDVPRALGVLRELGYPRPRQADHLPADSSQFAVIHPAHHTIVELHWLLAPPRHAYAFDMEAMWQRRERITVAGTPFDTFGAEDLMVLLCTHGVKHFWRRLHWLVSAAELLRVRPDLDWDLVMREADRIRGRRAVMLALYLSESLLEATIPPFITAHRRASIRRLAHQTYGWLFHTPGAIPQDLDPPGALRRAWFQFYVREGVREGWAYGKHRLRRLIGMDRQTASFAEVVRTSPDRLGRWLERHRKE